MAAASCSLGDYDPVAQELEGLSPWNEEQLREGFSLQALRVMGLLSSRDWINATGSD